ncbi:zinc-ribbon domain-containing protein [Pseudomonas chlororaphis]|uniref:zinc-ribbon domain-containing protein n=1 Tax=Pseudomonas chlororaphis TaxID=587753 RepID=UPI003B8A8061
MTSTNRCGAEPEQPKLHSRPSGPQIPSMTVPSLKTIEGMRQLAQSRGGWCLSDAYRNLSTRLSWRCEHGHEWLADPYRITRGSWCPVCARLQRRSTLETAQRIALERGGRCLSIHCESGRMPLEWQCSKEHRWQTTLASIKRGSWCPTCCRIGRRDTLEAMQQIAAKRGGRCLSESYIDSASALHWECGQGHRWEAVPASVKHRSWCPVCSMEARCNTLEQVQAVAKMRGGECLSTRYINGVTPLTWRCAEGHIWDAGPANILQGVWCRQCYHNSMRGDITAMRTLARARGGQCLSTHYVDSQTKLQWMCSIGHTWEAIPNSIKQGRWCPLCSFLAKCRNEDKKRKYL